MTFWSILLLAILGAYLLSTLGPWAALSLLNRSLRRRMAGVPAIEARARELDQARASARAAFPEVPRPGMYADLDRQAHTLLAQLAEEAQRLDTQRTDLLFFSPAEPGLLDILRWGAWPPLLDALRVLSGLNHIDETIAGSERMLFQLDELKHSIAALARAPRQRLRAALEGLDALEGTLAADRAEGVNGIAVDPAEIAAVRSDLHAALERIDHDQEIGLQVPQISRQVDTALAHAHPAIDRMRAIRDEARLRHDAAVTREALAAALSEARARVQGLSPDEGAEEQVGELDAAAAEVRAVLARLAQPEAADATDLATAVAAAGALSETLAALGYPRVAPAPEPETAGGYEAESEVAPEPAAEGEAVAAGAQVLDDEPEAGENEVAEGAAVVAYEAREPGEDMEAAPGALEDEELTLEPEPEPEMPANLPLSGYVRSGREAPAVPATAGAGGERGLGTRITRAVEEQLSKEASRTEREEGPGAHPEEAGTMEATAGSEAAGHAPVGKGRRLSFWPLRGRARTAPAPEPEVQVPAGPQPVYEQASADPAFQRAMQAIQTDDHAGGLATLQALRAHYPHDDNLERVIQWASMRSDLKPEKKARPRQIIVNWRRVAVTVVLASAVILAGFYAVVGVRRYVLPVLAERRAETNYVRLVARCDGLLAAENIAEAETCYNEALAQRPDDEAVQTALQDIESRNKLAAAYSACVSAYDAGNSEETLARCQEVQMIAPGYRDVQDRILTITQRARLDEIYEGAAQALEMGLLEDALAGFEQLASLDTNYRAQEVKDARVQIYIALGREIVSGSDPQLDLLLTANNYFAKALQLSPTQPEAQQERRLSSLFSEGVSLYQEGRWEDAIVRLRGVYDQRPSYFQQTLLSMLYDAYIRNGDQYRAVEDIGAAYERYYRASQLPVADTALAQLRLAEVLPLITPTPMPTITPTPTATLVPTRPPAGGVAIATPGPTALPTPRPMDAYANRIIYRSLQADQPGYYVREATGANPTYLGPTGGNLDQQYKALLDRYMFSPDGRYRLFVGSTGANQTAIFIEPPSEERAAGATSQQLTNLNGLSWDPAWSPDGGRIVFVSNTTGSDDIWIVNADGSGLRNLTIGLQSWDKRPSWSPDGTRIVFWSDRSGLMQLHVMDADGQNVRNISQTTWDETDPLWVR